MQLPVFKKARWDGDLGSRMLDTEELHCEVVIRGQV
jgi:hypothetical protein